MADIALLWTSQGFADIATAASDLLTDDGLQTAVIISLFTDRRAADGEQMPAGENDRRGWWGDIGELPSNWIGSRLWLLAREKVTSDVIARAEEYAREAVQWLIKDKIALKIDVFVESTRFQEIDMQILIHRPSGDVVKSRYAYNWQSQAAKILG